jgi:predicted enzyme related to lactoylglutathione lyase
MPNPFVHIELASSDADKAKAFFRSLFDWNLNDMDMGGGMIYTMIEVGEDTGGAMMKHPMEGAPSTWIPYVLVDDINASTEMAKQLGAMIVREVSEVPNMGWFSIIPDLSGAALGMWQPKPKE